MERLLRLALNPDGFAFDPTTGESFTLNPSALSIVQWLRDGLPHEEIIARLTEAFEVSADDASRDLDDFLDHLRSMRLV